MASISSQPQVGMTCSQCRRTASKNCPNQLCGSCCDRKDPCCADNHSRRGTARGTSRAGPEKVARRSRQYSLQLKLEQLRRSDEWFGHTLHGSGLTLRQFALKLYDHMLAVRGDPNNCSELSLRVLPAMMDKIEARVETHDETGQMSAAEIKEARDHVDAQEQQAERQRVQDTAEQTFDSDPSMTDARRAALREEIREGLAHEGAKERERMMNYREFLCRRLTSQNLASLVEDGKPGGVSEEKTSRLVEGVCPLAFTGAEQYGRFC